MNCEDKKQGIDSSRSLKRREARRKVVKRKRALRAQKLQQPQQTSNAAVTGY